MKFLNYINKKSVVNISMFFALTTCFNLNAQEGKPCRVDQENQTFYERNPSAKKEHSTLLRKLSLAQRSGNTASKADSYVIPVVVHVFGKEYNNGSTVTNAIVEEALKTTNEDFQGLNADYSTIDAPFAAIKKPLDITFKLAQLDPNGNPTTGVVYYDEASGMGNPGNPTVGEVAWDNYKYCNVYITRDLYADGDYYNSGVAWYPNTGQSNDGYARIVYNGSFLAGNTNENFRSVFTHEFGHWLDLPHTFAGGVCTNDPTAGDGVADTPSHKNNSAGTQCNVIQNCLGQEINNENFMDYTDCYKMFTQGQVARMINALDNSAARNTLWTNANLTATGINTNLGARIAASGGVFEERFKNDGKIDKGIDITCLDCTFTKTFGQMTLNTDYTVTNLPTGLTPRIVVNSNTSATIFLDNAPANHEAINSIDNLSITFLNPSVTGGVSGLYKDKLEKLKVSFKDVYTEFCDVNIRFATYAHITNVQFDGFKNPTGYDNNGNSNYVDNIVYPVKRGNTYSLIVTTNTGNAQPQGTDENRIQGWFDWNGDFILDEGELLISHKYSNQNTDTDGNYTYTTNVTIPNNANVGKMGFRLLVHYVQNTDGDNPCGGIDSGEREDYGLNVLDDSVGFEVNFSGNPTTVNFAEKVAFSDLSVTENGDSVVSRKWTFEGGNPATSTEKSPQVNFRNAGVYDVSLEVTTANGKTLTKTKNDFVTSRLQYCEINPSFGGYFNVNKVVLATMNHAPDKSNGYDYYDTVGTTLEIGKTYPMTITAELGNGGSGDVNRVRVWADWNFDSVFSDDELLITKVVNFADYDSNKEITFTENVTVPAHAASGKKIGLRVLGHYVRNQDGDTACGTIDSGNRADYGITISGISTDTCNDGIQNGDETGVDCGGSCGPCDPDPTCTDGIQNGDETGVDCGGSSCAPCTVAVDGAMVSTSDDKTAITTITGDGIADVISFKNTSQSTATYGYLITDEVGKILATETTSHDFEGAAAGICKVYGISYNGSLSVTGKNIIDRDLATESYDVSDNFITVTREDKEPDPTCTDGIQNGDETGVDCGGSCGPCNVTYCTANATNSNDEYISHFQLGSIDKQSASSTGGYSDFTSESTNLTKGDNETLTITPKWKSTVYSEAYSVWIDYNQDGDFADAGEQVWNKAASKDTPVSGQFTVPSDATNGSTRLRVIMRYNTVPSSCGNFNYGEVEDYTVVIGDGTVISCTDGIQNGDETGIDCGGSCGPCVNDGTVVYVDIDDKVASATSAWNFFRIEAGDNKDYGAWFSGNTLYLVTYDKDVVCVGATNNVDLLAEGVEVGASSNFVANSHAFVVSSSSYTDTKGKSGYIGFTFKIDNKVHYGWFYVTVANDGLSYTILDYAYNTTAGQGLLTTRNTNSSKSIAKEVKMYPNPFTNNLTIDVSGLGKDNFTMSVYNVLGKVIYQKVYTNNPKTIMLGENEVSRTGSYYVKIVSNNNTSTHAIIKQ